MDSLNDDGFGPDRRGDTDLGLAGKKGRDLVHERGVPWSLQEFLRRCVIRVLLKDANRVGIIVVVAVEIGLVRRVGCDPGLEMFLPNASNLVAFPEAPCA
jgi:hypothetical protein